VTEFENLENDLAAVGRAARYPATPDLAAGFWQGTAASGPDARFGRSPAWLGALAAGVAVIALVVVAGTGRDAAADLFDRINVFSTSEPLDGLPEGLPGEEVSIPEATAELGRPIEQPQYPEGVAPEGAVLLDFGEVKAVVIGYAQPGMPEFSLWVTNAHVGKGLAEDSGVRAETVSWPGAAQAYWFDGPHRLEFRKPSGQVVEESARRTVGNTLVWERDGYVYRLEGELERDEAIRVAQSLQ
jgi:hypothetical protein